MLDRKNASATLAGMPPVKGIVRRRSSLTDFVTERFPPGPDLEPWVEYFWTVDWNLPPGVEVESVVIGFPSLQLTAEVGAPGEVRHGARLPATLLHGITTTAFRIRLTASGSVVGARMRPGGLAAWVSVLAAALTNRTSRLSGSDPLASAHERLDWAAGAEQRADELRAILIRHRRAVPPDPDQLGPLLARMEADSDLVRVEQLVELTGWSMRTLQRRFRVQLGVTPKQVLSRFRLQEAAWQLEREPDLELADLAVRLGWYDQAHFSRDFRLLLGETPARYAARAAQTL
ncbi:MAG TPA: helix-turn-helix domain-containing protein [Propionibacteriaceae bacterium]|nr:helix-turn-helix domain-containing protein [Propionibacteriaceae bacterium]